MNETSQYYNGFGGLPVDISTHGWQIDKLFYSVHILMILLFVGWLSFLIYTLIKFRQRPGHKAEYNPVKTKLGSYLEVGVALVEVSLLVFLAVPAWKAAKTLRPTGSNVVQVRVVAEQFAWNIHFPGKDGVFGNTKVELVDIDNPLGLDPEDPASKDDIFTINDLHLPIDRPIYIKLTSKDVIHNFYVPVLRVKQDAVPGMVYPVIFQAKQTGSFDIACAQLCGLGHYRMKGAITMETEDDFQTWLSENAPSI
ncbi:MAG: cytochrome c oxidase subunit II [Bdellovibrionales bacterium]|nr:cytochrome c oxidase subunit II [Bdellovibrionales bacterium]